MLIGTPRLRLALAALLLAAVAVSAQEREPLEVYRGRRAALQEKLQDGLIILFGNGEGPGSEAYHLFRQEANFYYLTGYDEPGAVLLLAPPVQDRRSPFWEESLRLPREMLFLPPQDPQQANWTGPRPDPYDPATAGQTGFPAVRGTEQLASEIRRFAQGYPVVYTLLPQAHASVAEQAAEKENLEKLRTLLPFAEIRDARRAPGALRQVKSDSELKLIQHAVDCTIAGQQAAARELRPGLFEYEIAALMKYTFERKGCRGLAFDPTVGSGPRSTILHYNRNSARLEAGDLVVADVGAEYAYYASDITRTLPASGRFTARQREIYEIVLGAQKAAIQAVKPGMRISGHGSDSLYQIAYNYINTHGKDRHGEPLGKYFTHGLSHHVGLDVHDPGDPGRSLEAGMVITIEPGIYLPEESLGVRIEDMVLVTKTGYLLLTERLPREVQEIEKWMKK
ncbi:MAG: aminopeptidase P family protein [Acidobacteria bacterium]|nr:aminopeptidase P family protein [Acidobacteriota bacterium]